MVFVFSVLFGAFIGIFFLWFSSKNAVKDYPELRIHVPEGAENSPEWQAWAQENGYKLNDKGVWAKGTGMLTSATEIRFEGNDMLVQECINFLLGINRFAINAPHSGRQTRAHDENQALNQTHGAMASARNRV